MRQNLERKKNDKNIMFCQWTSYGRLSCVCLSLSDEPVLFCIYVCENVILFICLDGPRER